MKGRAEIRIEIESPGYYLINKKIVSVKTFYPSVDTEKLRQALELFNELADI
ncbi:hypothetical protein [Thermofilum sp.]|uniref:hypothetical protein n=1 Tax=Thermofilum sp. TaxID=1961369 RepID=UPI0031697829